MIAWYALSDGKTYAYPNYGYSTDDLPEGKGLVPNRCIVVRADMLEKLGYDATTLVDVKADEFLNMCERAVKEIGTYNDLSVIGMQLYEGGSEAADIMGQYLAMPWETEDGQYFDNLDRGREQGNLCVPERSLPPRPDLWKPTTPIPAPHEFCWKTASGRVFALIAAPQDFGSQFATLYEADPNAYYVPVVVRNANGDDPTLTDISGWGYLQTAITSSNKAPEQTIKMVNWLLSREGAIQMNKGWEGEQWQWEDDGTISILDSWKQATNDDPTLNKRYGINAFDLYANWAFLMQFEPKLDLDNRQRPEDLPHHGYLHQGAHEHLFSPCGSVCA